MTERSINVGKIEFLHNNMCKGMENTVTVLSVDGNRFVLPEQEFDKSEKVLVSLAKLGLVQNVDLTDVHEKDVENENIPPFSAFFAFVGRLVYDNSV